MADLRAPTPSAAAVAATPDRNELSLKLERFAHALVRALRAPTRHAGERLERAGDRLGAGVSRTLERASARVAEGGARLDALSPLRVLSRGYAVARDQSGAVLRTVAQFPAGLAFRLRVRDGEIAARAGEQ